jgi:acetylornithine deacetylase/succinyl-diaminopimelate desuccinylase-like protein
MDYIINGIKYVCLNFKERSSGSISEKECHKYFKKELSNYADQVEEETFSLHPKAFMGTKPVVGILDIISVLMLWLSLITDSIVFSFFGAALVLCSVLFQILEIFLYRQFIDFLFPKAVSTNIIARRAPKGEVKRRIVFGGHADAAYEMTYVLHGQNKTLIPISVGSTVGMMFILVFNIALFINALTATKTDIEFWKAIGIIETAFIPFFIALVFFTNWNLLVDGANDNLSGCFVGMGILKEMAEKNYSFEHTEVCCLITGGEESGIRGSLAYARRHKDEFLNVETIFIILDTMREIKHLEIFARGQNGIQKNSKAVGDLLTQAGKGCGIALPKLTLFVGATDAEAFSRYGIQACGFCGVNRNPRLYYHTRYDTWHNISEECLELSLNICIEASRLFDKQDIRKVQN